MYVVLRNDYTVVACYDSLTKEEIANVEKQGGYVPNMLPTGERPLTPVGQLPIPVVHLLLDATYRLIAAYWHKDDCIARCVNGLSCATYFVNYTEE